MCLPCGALSPPGSPASRSHAAKEGYLVNFQQSTSLGHDGGIPGVDDHRVLEETRVRIRHFTVSGRAGQQGALPGHQPQTGLPAAPLALSRHFVIRKSLWESSTSSLFHSWGGPTGWGRRLKELDPDLSDLRQLPATPQDGLSGTPLLAPLTVPTVTGAVPPAAQPPALLGPRCRGDYPPNACESQWDRGALTEREDFSECPLSFRTAKDAALERQPSSRHTPSHLTVWLVFQTGNCKHTWGVVPSRRRRHTANQLNTEDASF